MLKDLFQHLIQKLDSQPEQSEFPEENNSSPIGQLTSEKIKAIVAELAAAEPHFKAAGFSMEQLEIEVGILPKIVAQFKQLNEISKEHENQILDGLKDKRLIQFLLLSLFKASRMKHLMENVDMVFHGVEIEIAAPPSVRTIFKKINP